MREEIAPKWSSVPLGDLCHFQGGTQPPKSRFIDSPRDGYVRLLQIRDFKSDDKAVYVPDDGKLKKCVESDIMIGRYGASVGQIHRGKAGAYNVALIRTSPDLDRLDRDFFYHYLTSDLFQRPLLARSARGAQNGFNRADIAPFLVPLPSLEEQRRIVAVLDEAFEGLARARANAEANLQNARELFENALIALMEEIEKNSKRMLLSEAALDFGRGRSRHRPRNAPFLYGGPYPFVQTGDIRNAAGQLTEYTQTYSEEGLSQSKLWPTGTVCITIAANIAETAVLGFDGCFPDSVIGMVPDGDVTFPEYVEYMLRFFAADLKAQGKGSAQDNINLATFERASFPFPSLSEQRSLVSKLDQLWTKSTDLVWSYSKQLSDLDDLRQSLLQQAFAGALT